MPDKTYRDPASGKTRSEGELIAKGASSAEIGKLVASGAIEEVATDGAPAENTGGGGPGKSYRDPKTGKVRSETELLAKGATADEIKSLVAKGAIEEVGGAAPKKKEAPASYSTQSDLSGVIPSGPNMASTSSAGSTGQAAPAATPAAAPGAKSTLKTVNDQLSKPLMQQPLPKAPLTEIPATDTPQDEEVGNDTEAGFNEDNPTGASKLQLVGKDFGNVDAPIRGKTLLPELPAKPVSQEKEMLEIARLAADDPTQEMATMTQDQVKRRMESLLGRPVGDNTTQNLRRLQNDAQLRGDQERLGERLRSLQVKAVDQMRADPTPFINKNSKTTMLNGPALENLLETMSDERGNPLNKDDKEELYNRIARNMSKGMDAQEQLAQAGTRYDLDDVAIDRSDNRSTWNKLKSWVGERLEKNADMPLARGANLSGTMKMLGGYLQSTTVNKEDQIRNANQPARKGILVDGEVVDPLTAVKRSTVKATKEYDAKATDLLNKKMTDLQADVNEGRKSSEQATDELQAYQRELQGDFESYVRRRVPMINKEIGIGVVYQAEINALQKKIQEYKADQKKEGYTTSVRLELAEARMARLLGLQATGEYAQDDDPHWKLAMAQAYKDLVIKKNEALKDHFNNAGLSNQRLDKDATLREDRILLAKNLTGIMNGIGGLESMAGGVLNMMGMYTMGHRLTERGKEYQAENELPMPMDEDGNEMVIDKNVSTWLARNVGAQIPLMAGLAVVSEMTGGAGAALIEGLSGGRQVGSFLKGAMGGLGTVVPEAKFEAGEYYNQSIAEGKSVRKARDGAESVFLQNLVILGVSSPIEFGLMKIPTDNMAGKLFRGGFEAHLNGSQEVFQNWTQKKEADPRYNGFRGIVGYALSPEGQSSYLAGAAIGAMQNAVMGRITDWQVKKGTDGMFSFLSQNRGPDNAALPNNYVIANTALNAFRMAPGRKRAEQLKGVVDRLQKSGSYTVEEAAHVKSIIDKVKDVKDMIPNYGTQEQQNAVFNELLRMQTLNQYASESGIDAVKETFKERIKVREERIKRIMDNTEPLYFVNGLETSRGQLASQLDKMDKEGMLTSKNVRISVANDPAMQDYVMKRIDAAKKAESELNKKFKNKQRGEAAEQTETTGAGPQAQAAPDPEAEADARAEEKVRERQEFYKTNLNDENASSMQKGFARGYLRDPKKFTEMAIKKAKSALAADPKNANAKKALADAEEHLQDLERVANKKAAAGSQTGSQTGGAQPGGTTGGNTTSQGTTQNTAGTETGTGATSQPGGTTAAEGGTTAGPEPAAAGTESTQTEPEAEPKPGTGYQTAEDDLTIFGRPEKTFTSNVTTGIEFDRYQDLLDQSGATEQAEAYFGQVKGFLASRFEAAGISPDLATDEVTTRFMGEIYERAGLDVNEEKPVRDVANRFIEKFISSAPKPGATETQTSAEPAAAAAEPASNPTPAPPATESTLTAEPVVPTPVSPVEKPANPTPAPPATGAVAKIEQSRKEELAAIPKVEDVFYPGATIKVEQNGRTTEETIRQRFPSNKDNWEIDGIGAATLNDFKPGGSLEWLALQNGIKDADDIKAINDKYDKQESAASEPATEPTAETTEPTAEPEPEAKPKDKKTRMSEERRKKIDERQKAFRDAINNSRKNANSGVDFVAAAKILARGLELVAAYVEDGAITFRDMVMDLIENYGKDYGNAETTEALRRAYAAHRSDLEDTEGYSTDQEMRSFIQNELPAVLEGANEVQSEPETAPAETVESSNETAEPASEPAAEPVEIPNTENQVTSTDETGSTTTATPGGTTGTRSMGEETGSVSTGEPSGNDSATGTDGATGTVPGSEGDGSNDNGTGTDKTGDTENDSEGDRNEPDVRPTGGIGVNDDINRDLGGHSVDKPVPGPGEGVVEPSQNGGNFVIPSNFEHTSTFNPARKFRDNIAALETLRDLVISKQKPTLEQQQTLFRYVGWGGLKEVLYDTRTTYSYSWTKSNEDLKPLVEKVRTLAEQLDINGIEGAWSRIKDSVLNAHYTSIPIIRGMYTGLTAMGFSGGRILEPSAGIGHFLGAMPKAITDRSMLTAIEKDSITGNILSRLYPDASTIVNGFEKAFVPNDSQDLVISNIPFGDYNVSDPAFQDSRTTALVRSQKKIHNYFVAKAIEVARPGGLVYLITSSGTLDSADNEFIRRHIASTAEFIGAVRLPETAFKSNANTEVVTDIILLRKFNRGEKSSQQHKFLETKEVNLKHHEANRAAQDVDYNEYFHKNPQNILGKPMAGGMYSSAPALTVIAPKSQDIEAEVTRAIGKIVEGRVYSEAIHEATDTDAQQRYILESANGLKTGNLTIQDGKVGHAVVEGRDNTYTSAAGNQFMPVEGRGAPSVAVVQAFIEVRDTLNDLFAQEISGSGKEIIADTRRDLNTAYDAFVAAHGQLNTVANKKAISYDVDSFNVLALERFDKQANAFVKSDIFTKSTVRSFERKERADSFKEALLTSLGEKGIVDPARVASLMDRSFADLIADNPGFVFELPEGGWEMSDAYLAGNVRAKLKTAKTAAGIDARFEPNVKALEAVQPKDLRPAEITIQLGARWVPVKYYDEFAKEIFNARDAKVGYLRGTDTFKVIRPNGSFEESNRYATGRMNGSELLNHALHQKTPEVWTKGSRDEPPRVDKEETEKAIEKMNIIKEMFANWIWKTPERREVLARLYNDLLNNTVKQRYDGSHLTFPGMSLTFEGNPLEFMQHQKDGVWMLLQRNGGIIDHIVGAGKTLLMVAAAMEMKRLGIARKTMMVVMKSTIGQIQETFAEAYPLAKVLYPKEGDFSEKNRKTFLSQIATNDWDAVIISHENYKAIPQDAGFQRQIYQEEVDALDLDIAALQGERGDLNKRQLKDLQKRKLNLQAKMERLSNFVRDNDLRNFQELGVDHIMVDESQQFKNLAYSTRSRGVAGLGKPDGSQRAFNLLMGMRWLQQQHRGEKGVTFLSGTPISNSVVEMYLLLKYMRPSKMRELDLNTFDGWASVFATHSSDPEFSVAGELKNKERYREFTNLPELAILYAEMADVRNDSNLKLPKPKMQTGGMQLVSMKPTEVQTTYFQNLIQFARTKNPSHVGLSLTAKQLKAYMLLITNLAAKASIDLRLIDPVRFAGQQSPKINALADSAAKIFHDTTEHLGTQLIFSDIGTPKSGKGNEDLFEYMVQERTMSDEDLRLLFGEYDEEEYKMPALATIKKRLVEVFDYTADRASKLIAEAGEKPRFNVYDEIKERLIERGVPKEQIVFIHSYNTDLKKAQLFADVKQGKIRIVLGSTQKLGTGVNVQTRMVAGHHLDAPWKPSDMQQRNGRYIRQGNIVARDFYNNEVPVYAYATEGSLDTYKYQLLDIKEKMIESIKTNSTGQRVYKEGEGDEETGMSFAAFLAILSGNPDVLDRAKFEKKVQALASSKRNHEQEHYEIEDKMRRLENERRADKSALAALKKDRTLIEKNSEKDPADGKPVFKIQLFGKDFTDFKEVGQHFFDNKIPTDQMKAGEKRLLGSLWGMDIIAEGELFTTKVNSRTVNTINAKYYLQGEGYAYRIETHYVDATAQGKNFADVANKVPRMIEYREAAIVKADADMVKFKEQLGEKWDKEDELAEAQKNLAEINARLSATAKANEAEAAAAQGDPVRNDDDSEDPDDEDDTAIDPRLVETPAAPLYGPSDAFYNIVDDGSDIRRKEKLNRASPVDIGLEGEYYVGQMASGRWGIVHRHSGSIVRSASDRQTAIDKGRAVVKEVGKETVEKAVRNNVEDIRKTQPDYFNERYSDKTGYDESWEEPDPWKAFREAKKEFHRAMGDQANFGVSPAAIAAFAKMAYQAIRGGVKNLAGFAKRVGSKVSPQMAKAWNAATKKYRARQAAKIQTRIDEVAARLKTMTRPAPIAMPAGLKGSAFTRAERDISGQYAVQMLADFNKAMFGSEDLKENDAFNTHPANRVMNLPNLLQDIASKNTFGFVSKALRFVIEKAMENRNNDWSRISRPLAEALNSLFANLGKDENDIIESEKLVGKGRVLNVKDGLVIDGILRGLVGNNKASLDRIQQVLDPEFHTRVPKDEFLNLYEDSVGSSFFSTLSAAETDFVYQEYVDKFGFDKPGYKLHTAADLNENEKIVYDVIRFMYDMMHHANYKMEFLTPSVFADNLGTYSARLYDFYEIPTEVQQMFQNSKMLLNTDLYKMKGELTYWKLMHGISDPIYAANLRLAQTMANQAIVEYGVYLQKEKPGAISDVEAPGYKKMGKGFGPLSRKWVRQDIAEDFIGFYYGMKWLNDTWDWLKRYDAWDVRQWAKQMLTVIQPAVMLGNVLGNILFSFLQGINPVRMIYNIPWAFRQGTKLTEEYSEEYRFAAANGVTSSDFTYTDLKGGVEQLNGRPIDQRVHPVQQFFRTLLSPFRKSYAAVDDIMKLAAFKSNLQLGYTPKQAADKVKEHFQSFKRVGKAYSFFSKIPLVGNMFGSFAGQTARFVKASITTRPLQLLLLMTGLRMVADTLSRLSGESDEKRRQRYNKRGAPKVPWFSILGGDVPLEWYVDPKKLFSHFMDTSDWKDTGGDTYNLARIIMPLYLYGSADGNDQFEFWQKLSPQPIEFPDDTTNYHGPVAVFIAENFTNDIIPGVLISLAVDADGLGIPIWDPKQQPGIDSNLSAAARAQNGLRYLFRNYVPYGGTMNDLYNAMTGQKDYYNRDRTPAQVMMNFLFGIKTAQFPETKYGQLMEQKMNYFQRKADPIQRSLKGLADKLKKGEITEKEYLEIYAEKQQRLTEILDAAKKAYFEMTGDMRTPDLRSRNVIEKMMKSARTKAKASRNSRRSGGGGRGSRAR